MPPSPDESLWHRCQLAGRACLFTLLPFALDELRGLSDELTTDEIMLRGFFPGTVLKGISNDIFYSNYQTTYIERDLRQIKQVTDLKAFQKFIRLVAGRTGSEVNAAAIANEAGISSPTIRSWYSVLETSYLTYTLQPYHANIAKRLVKSPKVYFIDTGLLCQLLSITTAEQLSVHPLRGAVFENLVVTEMVKAGVNSGQRPQLYFYRENSGHEVDIVKETAGRLSLYEIKSSSTFNPAFLTNMKYLKALLGDQILSSSVIYDGDHIPPDVYNFKQFFSAP